MISAKEAREKAETKYEQEVIQELAFIEEQILEAVDKCNMSVTIFKYLHTKTTDELEKLGYRVEMTTSQKDGTEYTIYW